MTYCQRRAVPSCTLRYLTIRFGGLGVGTHGQWAKALVPPVTLGPGPLASTLPSPLLRSSSLHLPSTPWFCDLIPNFTLPSPLCPPPTTPRPHHGRPVARGLSCPFCEAVLFSILCPLFCLPFTTCLGVASVDLLPARIHRHIQHNCAPTVHFEPSRRRRRRRRRLLPASPRIVCIITRRVVPPSSPRTLHRRLEPRDCRTVIQRL